MEKKTFKPGPIQEQWLQSLEQHPERQMTGSLGRSTGSGSDDYQACCLGEGLICLLKAQGKEPVFKNNALIDISSMIDISNIASFNSATLRCDTYQGLGLYDSVGSAVSFRNPSLVELNDSGKTWPEIAAIIRANPSKYFTHPV